jgi:hypothetical protein
MKPLPPLRYPPRAAKGGGDASSPPGERDARVASPQAADSHSLKPGDGGVAATPERRDVASTHEPK